MSQDAIISHTLDGKILSWNHGAEEMFGHRTSEAIGSQYRTLISGESAEEPEVSLVTDRCRHGVDAEA